MKGERSEMHAYFAVETAIFGYPEVLGRSLGGSGSSRGSLEALRFLSHVKRNNAIPKKSVCGSYGKRFFLSKTLTRIDVCFVAPEALFTPPGHHLGSPGVRSEIPGSPRAPPGPRAKTKSTPRGRLWAARSRSRGPRSDFRNVKKTFVFILF